MVVCLGGVWGRLGWDDGGDRLLFVSLSLGWGVWDKLGGGDLYCTGDWMFELCFVINMRNGVLG